MATSGSVDWSVSRDNVIAAAYRKVLVDEDFSPTANQTSNASLLLNGIVKSWGVSLGIPLWSIGYGYILPVSGASSAVVPGSTHVVSSVSSNKLGADAAATDLTVTVDTATGDIDTYAIGIELDSGDMHWTVVNGTPAGSVVTLTVALPSAASSGNFIYYYPTTARLNKILRVVGAYRFNVDTITAAALAAYTVTPMEIVTNTAWFAETTNYFTEGSPIKLSYEPLASTGTLRWWPRFQDGKNIIFFRYHRTLEDFDATGDTPDFPQEYFLPLVYELACALAPDYNVSIEKFRILRSEADKWLEKVSNNDYEEGSILFEPDSTYRRM